MKKFLISAFAAFAAVSASATDYVVFADHELGSDEVQISYGDYVNWDGGRMVISTIEDGTAWNVKCTNSADGWCGGGYISTDFDQTLLHTDNMTLKFDVRADQASAGYWCIKYVIKTTSGNVETEHRFDFVADGEWHTVSLNLKDTDAAFYNKLTVDPATVNEFYAITFVGHSNADTDQFDVKNIRYEDNVEPSISIAGVSVSDITAESANVNYTLSTKNFDGGTFSVRLYGDDIDYSISDNKTSGTFDLDLLSESTTYNLTMVAQGAINGQVYTSEPVNVSFKTKSATFVAQTWYQNFAGSVNYNNAIYNINVDCAFTTTENGAVNVRAKVLGGENLINAGGYKFHVIGGGHEQFMPLTKVDGEDYVWEATTEFGGFNEGDAITMMQPYFEYPGNAFHVEYYGYVYGATNENTAALKPILTAISVDEVGTDYATISYTVANASEFDEVNVLIDGEALTSNTINDLEAGKLYSIELSAVGTKDDVQYIGDATTVSFSTIDENATEKVWYQYTEGVMPMGYLSGETYDDGRDLAYTALVKVIYYAGKVTVELTLDGDASKMPTLNPQLHVGNSFIQKSAVRSTTYVYEVPGTFAEGASVGSPFAMFYAYDRQAKEVAIEGYTTGDVNDNPTSGITAVAADSNAAVEYFNLQGVRVANPENGIFIRRQGNSVSKVVIR